MSDVTVQEATPTAAPPAPDAEQRAKQLMALEDVEPLRPFGSLSTFVKAQRMAHALASSTMIPESYQQWILRNNEWQENKNAIGNVMVAMELSQRLRCGILAIMQNVDVVKGRPGFRGAFCKALVDESPLFGRLKYEMRGTENGLDEAWRAYAVEKETGEILFGAWISWKMVTGEGWDKNTKWTTMRQQMFMYRAASFWVKAHAPELLMGMQTVDELEDVDVTTVPSRPLASLNERLNAGLTETVPADAPASDPSPSENFVVISQGHSADQAADSPSTEDASIAPTPTPSPRRGRRSPPATSKPPLEQAEPKAVPPTESPSAVVTPSPSPSADAAVDPDPYASFNLE